MGQPELARMGPEGAKSSQELQIAFFKETWEKKVEGSCGAARSSQEGPEAARSSQELQIAFFKET